MLIFPSLRNIKKMFLKMAHMPAGSTLRILFMNLLMETTEELLREAAMNSMVW